MANMSDINLYHIRRHFSREKVDDVAAEVRQQLDDIGLSINPGSSVAIATGSRGVAGISLIVRATVDFIRSRGAEPFIIPGMGSHGGGSAEGQSEILASYGITSDKMGAPVRSSMDVVDIPAPHLDNNVYMDKQVWNSDGVILINRIKPHTDFHGRWESGLVKMAVIGLGKHRLAQEIHSYGIHGLRDLIMPTARVVLETGKVLAGIGVVENAYDEPMMVKALPASQIIDGEPELLEIARGNMPALPLDRIDVLIVDRMGKDISGVGIDTNIIGRMYIRGEEEPDTPSISSIVVTDLTEASHGNAIGMGLADIITRRMADKIDGKATYENSITSSFLDRAKMPLVAENDRKALAIALRSAGCRDPLSSRIVRIGSTLELEHLLVSKAALDEIGNIDGIEVLSGPKPVLNDAGNFSDF